MDELWVLDASPLIVLARIGRLDLLSETCKTVLIPEAVITEIARGPSDDPARQALESGWSKKSISVEPDSEILEWGLGAGETAVLTLARHRHGRAVVDDRAARTACSAFGIRHIGTLGIILRAKQRGKIPSSVEVLRELVEAGFRLDDRTIHAVLKETTGEKWPE
ncbi:MAG: DUF3368 domain-containing protein [Candidatus Hydrogenedentota bacterium]|nr:MAG: DUF3368 domain-containing protein [Candidatus Hydrogenedentota bacterium]